MTNGFYVATGEPGTGAFAASAPMRSEFQDIEGGFNLMPALTAGTAVVVNGAGTALANTVGRLALAGNFTTLGAFAANFTFIGVTDLTFPTSGTVATTSSPAASIVVGSTTIIAGTTGRILYDNGGTLGEMTTTGSGTVVALATSPTITTPLISGALTYGGVALAASVTGTGSMALSISPTFSGIISSGAIVTSAGTYISVGRSLTNAYTIEAYGADGAGIQFVDSSNGVRTFMGAASSVGRAGTFTTHPYDLYANGSAVARAETGGGFTINNALKYGGVTLAASVTGTGSMVLATAPTVSALTVAGSFTATGLVTNADLTNSTTTLGSTAMSLGSTYTTIAGAITWSGSQTMSAALVYGGVTLSNAVTGTGNMVLSASPTFSGTIGGAVTFSGALTLSSALTYGGVALSNSVTGTGSMVLGGSPTLTTPVLTGLPTGTGVASAATVSTLVSRDAGGSIRAVNYISASVLQGALQIGSAGIISVGAANISYAGNSIHGLEIEDTANQSGSLLIGFYNQTPALIGSVSNNGSTGVLFNTTSDGRMKTDIKPASLADAETILSGIEVVRHGWVGSDRRESFSAIAQDVHKVFPEMITPPRAHMPDDPDSNPWMRSDTPLIMVLVAGWQALAARVAQLEKGIS